MLVNGVLFSLIAGYVAHQIQQFGVAWKDKLDAEKATIDNRLKSLIKWDWVEKDAEGLVNGIVDVIDAVLVDESDVKTLLLDLEGKDWTGSVAVIGTLITKNYQPTSDAGKLVLEAATAAVSGLATLVDGAAAAVASPVVGESPVVTAEVAPAPSPLVTDDHVAGGKAS